MLLEVNISIIERRWPGVSALLQKASEPDDVELLENSPEKTLSVAGITLTSRYDRGKEARSQALLVPLTAESVWVYGMALGDLPTVLLERPHLRKVSVVIMSMAVAKVALSYFDFSQWLANPRIELVDGSELKDIAVPFTCAPALLYLAEERTAKLRDQLFLELASPYIHQQQQVRRQEYLEQIQVNIPSLEKSLDVKELFGSQSGADIVVAAAGPTLTKQYDWLKKKRENSTLIAVDAAVKPLLAAGIIPDVVVSTDGHPDLFQLLFAGLDFALLRQTKLVFFPIVASALLHAWPGELVASYCWESIYDDLNKQIPRGFLYSSGSVIHTGVDLAVQMKAGRVFLVGADFSYPYGVSHADGCAGQVQVSHESGCWVLNGRGERVATSPNLRGYLRDFERYLALHSEVEFYNTGLDGAQIEGTAQCK